MDSFEYNKIAGAVLGTLLGLVSLGIVAEAVYTPHKPVKPGFDIPVEAAESTGAATAPAVAPAKPIAIRLASADPKVGMESAQKCIACHSFGKGEKAKVGPNLYGVLDAPLAHAAGYAYSTPLKAQAAEGKKWTYEALDTFLQSPKAMIPGTKMTFPGVPKEDERAAVIAYLRTLSDSPAPLPTPPTN